MKILLNILIGLISVTGVAQTYSDLQTDYLLTKDEVSDLNSIFTKNRNDFDFQEKLIAYTVGTSGTQIENKSVFFEKYLTPVIKRENKNVCVLIILTKEEKIESGGFDAVIMAPAKIFTTKHREILIDQLSKISKSYKKKPKYKEVENIDLNSVFLVNSVSLFKGYYYQGSDSAFHYFISKWDYKKDKYFKLKSKDLKVLMPYRFMTNEIRISIMISNLDFGNNDFGKLYIQE
jgi:hypothetical protein